VPGLVRILVIEDNPGDFRLLQTSLSEVGETSFELVHENRLAGGLERLAREEVDLVLLDLGLPDSGGLGTFTRLHQQAPNPPVIVLSGTESEEWAVEAVRLGAQDYLVKGQVSGPLLVRAIRYALQRKQAQDALLQNESRYRALFEAAGDATLILRNGRIVDCNERTLAFFHSGRDGLLGRPPAELSPALQPDGRASAESIEERLRAALEGAPQVFEWRLQLGDGAQLDVEMALTRIDLQGEAYVQALLRDITGRKRTEQDLQRANEKLAEWVRELEQRSQQAILLNEMGNLLQSCLTPGEIYAVLDQYAGRLFPKLTGGLYVFTGSYELLEKVVGWGRPPQSPGGMQSQDELTPQDCWALRRGRAHVVSNPASQLCCHHLAGAPGGAGILPYLCLPLGAHGEIMGLFYLQQDSTQPIQSGEVFAGLVAERAALALANLKLREALRTQSIRDALTGLLNRRYMEEAFQRELYRAARRQLPLSVIAFSIDRFDAVTAVFGQEGGEVLLRELGVFLRNYVSPEDISCRCEDENFLLIYPEMGLEDAVQRAELLRADVQRLLVQYLGRPLGRITISCGVASAPRHGVEGRSVLTAAAGALQAARKAGGDQVAAA